jgi:hypothetical protein
MKMKKIGELAFLVGVLIAILVGLFQQGVATGTLATILVILGIIVGFLNISAKETTPYLVAAIALLAASGASGFISIWVIGSYLVAMLGNIALFVAPAAVIVALKTIITLAKKK